MKVPILFRTGALFPLGTLFRLGPVPRLPWGTLLRPRSLRPAALTASARLRGRGLTDPPRSGLAIVLVVVMLLVASGLSLAIVRNALLQAGQAAFDRRQYQAEQLAEAGLDRLRSQLQQDRGFSGDRWTVTVLGEPASGDAQHAGNVRDAGGARDPGGVQGQVQTRMIASEGNSRRVEVVAVYPLRSARPAKVTRQQTIRLAGSE